MTDALLLAEIRRDKQLRRYDTVIVDQAHERSLNIDFCSLPRARAAAAARPEVIITSATIDPERFNPPLSGAPVSRCWAHVPGRAALPAVEDPDRDQEDAIADASTSCCAKAGRRARVPVGGARSGPADFLRADGWMRGAPPVRPLSPPSSSGSSSRTPSAAWFWPPTSPRPR